MANATTPNSARSETEVVHYTIADRIATITIDRPEVLNAINPAVRKPVIEAVSDASINPQVWVVVITGTGDRIGHSARRWPQSVSERRSDRGRASIRREARAALASEVGSHSGLLASRARRNWDARIDPHPLTFK